MKAAGIAPAVDLPKAGKRIAVQLGAAQGLSLLREHCGCNSPFIQRDRKALKRLVEVELSRRRRAIAVSSRDLEKPQTRSSADN